VADGDAAVWLAVGAGLRYTAAASGSKSASFHPVGIDRLSAVFSMDGFIVLQLMSHVLRAL